MENRRPHGRSFPACPDHGSVKRPPDSFSDGGEFFTTEKASKMAVNMAAEGAEIIDVEGIHAPGAETSFGGRRTRAVLPVIATLREKITAFFHRYDQSRRRARSAEAGASISMT